MPQQYLNGDANNYYKKRLFVDTGFEYVEVGAKIIEPYSPPEPVMKFKEHKLISAPSHLHHQGFSSYRAKIKLLFADRQSYSTYLQYASNKHKFYDEKGSIYIGAVESITRTVHEASKKYGVELGLYLLKKDEYDMSHRNQFEDLTDVATGQPVWCANDVIEMADLGIITTHFRDGSPVKWFNGDNFVSRAEFAALLNRTRRWLEQKIRE